MKKQFVLGKTPDEKLDAVERTLQQFSRRLHKTVIGVIPPAPVFGYLNQLGPDGVIFRGLVPVNMILSYAGISMDVPKQEVTINISADGEDEGLFKTFKTKRQLSVVEPKLSIKGGSKVTIAADQPLTNVWYGLILDFELNSMAQKQFMIEELERLLGAEE
jgi:hypothetical protein